MLNPRYLDEALLKNMCDNYGIDTVEEVQVTSKNVSDRKTDAGVDKVVKGAVTNTTTSEETQTFSRIRRPVRLLNELHARLAQDEDLIDYVQDPYSSLVKGYPIIVEGEFKSSPVAEFGSIMAPLLPRLFQQAAAGNEEPELEPGDFAAILGGGGPGSSTPSVFEIEPDVEDAPRFVVALKPGSYIGEYSSDDITGELSAFGLIERIIRPGQKYSLEKYLLPGIGRAARRQMLSGMANSLPVNASGQKMKAEDLEIRGPAIIVDVAAVVT